MLRGFLVLGGTPMDNVPMGLLETRKQAELFADQVDEKTIIDYANQILKVDCSSAICVQIVEFNAGVPSPVEIYKVFV